MASHRTGQAAGPRSDRVGGPGAGPRPGKSRQIVTLQHPVQTGAGYAQQPGRALALAGGFLQGRNQRVPRDFVQRAAARPVRQTVGSGGRRTGKHVRRGRLRGGSREHERGQGGHP